MHVGHRSLAALAAHGLVASVLLTGAPAQATPVFADAETYLVAYSQASSITRLGGSGVCDNTSTGGAGPHVPVIENGAAASASYSATSTFTNSGVPGDTGTGVASVYGTGEVASADGNLSTMDLSVTSSAQLVNALGTSADCFRNPYAGVRLEFAFSVAQPGFLGLSTKNTQHAYGAVLLLRDEAGGSEDTVVGMHGDGLDFDSTSRVFLTAGTYRGSFQGGITHYSLSSYAISGTTTMRGEFHVAGSRTAEISGKGRKYVTLPGARSCATHALVPSITGKKKRASQVTQVRFFVNGKQVKKVKTPDRGDAILVPMADDQPVEVVAKVKLLPQRKGKAGKVVNVRASYEACS